MWCATPLCFVAKVRNVISSMNLWLCIHENLLKQKPNKLQVFHIYFPVKWLKLFAVARANHVRHKVNKTRFISCLANLWTLKWLGFFFFMEHVNEDDNRKNLLLNADAFA